MQIILASNSDRRRDLLEQAGIPFIQKPSNVVEESLFTDEISPFGLVQVISKHKAEKVCEEIDDDCVIVAGDTVVSYHGKIMGKPKNDKESYEMLKMLQGKAHSVYTGVTVIKKVGGDLDIRSIVDTTTVYMRQLTNDEIWAYVKTGEPYDKAGGYAIQEKGSLLIEGIEGDYYNVVGLPLSKLYMLLKELNIDLTSVWTEK